MSRPRFICALLALVTLLVYLPVRHYPFVNFDDGLYVTEDPVVQAGLTWAGVEYAFTSWYGNFWHPLTCLSHMLDCQLFGLNAGGHHLVNVLFHTLNTVLLFLLLLRLTSALWQSALVAALFAWHPLRVESVAWVAERKDVLSAFFGLLTLTAYVRYVQRQAKAEAPEPSGGTAPPTPRVWCASRDYFLALLCFALGLMSKPVLVTLPFVLLLLDYWPLQRAPGFELRFSRWSRLVLEKWPFFALAAASCVLTLMAKRGSGAVVPLTWEPPGFRLENAVVSYTTYLLKTIWPINLAVIYPLRKEISPVQVLSATMMLILISWLVWRRRRHEPYLLTGWLWFLGMLVPVIGLMQVGAQAMADRFTYLPQIGLFIAVTYCIGYWVAKLRLNPAVVISVAGLVLAGYLAATAHQLLFWQDSEPLFRHALAVTRDNQVAQNNLADILFERGQVDEAIIHYRKALEIRPNDADAYINLGVAFTQKGQVDEAIVYFQKALAIQPNLAQAHNNLGIALRQKGQVDEAIIHFRKTLEIHPNDAEAHFNLGTTLLKKGQVDEAMAHYQAVLAIRPENIKVLNNLAWVLATAPNASLRNGAKAVELAQQANLLAGGNDPAILCTLAAAYEEAGQFPEAVATARRALQLAERQSNAELADFLRMQIGYYEAGSPIRDSSLTNDAAFKAQP